MSYESFKKRVKKERPDLDFAALEAAYLFAASAHQGQKRYSGEDYVEHPLAAAEILLDLNPDLACLQACILHDVTEDTARSLKDIEKQFGPEVAKLVKGCEKLSVVKLPPAGKKSEKWKDLFLAMASDVRIVLIKLSDRLHNMRTIEYVPKEKQKRIAQESLEVHAAIASHMGIYQIKSELEDLCFKVLYPKEYASLEKKLAEYREKSDAAMRYATSALKDFLSKEKVEVALIQGRMKHIWSIHQKLQGKDVKELSEIYDLFAVRIVLPDQFRDGHEQVSQLYGVLGLLHNEYLPLQDRFKDYVAVPKPNGYRSLHTTVLGLGGDLYDEPTEIQIRSMTMHREAELGIASHTLYKLDKKPKRFLDKKRHFALHAALAKVQVIVRENPDIEHVVKDWVEHYQEMKSEDRATVEKVLLSHGLNQEDLDHIRKGRSQENFTLQTNVDEQLAWLRGFAEQPEVKLDLDFYPNQIFVLTPRRDVMELPRGATPLDFAFLVHTEVGNHAVHAKVNGRIVPLDHELQNGDMVEIGTRSSAKPSRYWLSVVKTSSARNKIKNWFFRHEKQHDLKQDVPIKEATPEPKAAPAVSTRSLTGKVLITGEEDLPVVLSACCQPHPPQAIIGYVTRGRNIRVHRQSCQELSGLNGERFVSAHWKVLSESEG